MKEIEVLRIVKEIWNKDRSCLSYKDIESLGLDMDIVDMLIEKRKILLDGTSHVYWIEG